MTNILKKESSIEEKNKTVKEERTKEEIKLQDEFYSLVDKAYYVDQLYYKIGT